MSKRILLIIIAVLLVVSLCACNGKNVANTPTQSLVVSSDEEWPTEFLSTDVLPKIQSGDINYYKLYGRVLRIYIYNLDEAAFLQYIELLKQTGYSNISVETKEAFSGSMGDYHLVMNRDDDTNKMVMELTTPLTWPREGYITMLPTPKNIKVLQIIGESNNITVILEDIGKENFNAYTTEIVAVGFSTIIVTSETVFVAENEKFIVTIVRQPDKNTMDIGVYEKN